MQTAHVCATRGSTGGRKRNMTRIHTTIVIKKPVVEVFHYATTPANWPKWHPSSLAVRGTTNHSLLLNEALTEEVLVARRRGTIVWKVIEREAPYRWVIKGQMEGGGAATISYNCKLGADGTVFERELVYRAPNPVLALLHWLILRRRIKAESVKALNRLKSVLGRIPSDERRPAGGADMRRRSSR